MLQSAIADTRQLFFKIKEAYDAEVVLQVLQKESLLVPKVQRLLVESSKSCSETQLHNVQELVQEIREYRLRDALAFASAKEVDQLVQRSEVLQLQKDFLNDSAARVEEIPHSGCRDSLSSLESLQESALGLRRESLLEGFENAVEAVSTRVIHLNRELQLLKQLQNELDSTSIRAVKEQTDVSSLDLSYCNLDTIRALNSELSALPPLSLDGRESLTQLSSVIELREAVIEAVDMGESATDKFWSRVEECLKAAQQALQSQKGFLVIDQKELELVVTELALRSEVDDVIVKLDTAVQELNDRDLEVVLRQGERLKLDHHKDEQVRALLEEASSLLPILYECRAALQEALSEVTMQNLCSALDKQRQCLFGEEPGSEGSELVLQVKKLFARSYLLESAAELALKTLYIDCIQVSHPLRQNGQMSKTTP